MKTKNKKILTVGLTGLTAIPAITTPLMMLSSCGNSKNVKFEDYDKEYGVDKFVYNTIEKKFEKAFNDKVASDDTIPDDVKPLEIERNKNALAKFRGQLDKLIAAKDTRNLAYTTVSNALIDYAEREYGIKLNRETKASFSEIDRLYKGLYDSWRSTMINSGMNPATMNEILQDVQKNFTAMRTSLTAKYDDALAALIQAKRQMAYVFASVNKEIGLMAASMRLQEFLQNYNFEFNENGTENRIDQLDGSTLTVEGKEVKFEQGADITPWINNIFTIRDAHTGNLLEGGFRKDIIPGYKITPVLACIDYGTEFNEHSIGIDWRCVKTTFTGEDEMDATAHLYNPKQTNVLAGIQNGQSVNEILNDKENKAFMPYSIPKTNEKVLKDLQSMYPTSSAETRANNSTGILFKWDENEKGRAYDPFIQGNLYDSKDGYDYYSISEEQLADSGLMVSTNNGESYHRIEALLGDRRLSETPISANDAWEKLSEPDRQFIKGCVIYGEVMTKTNDAGEHWAKVTIHYGYRNKPEERITVEFDESETSGFPYSEKQFKRILNLYNEARIMHKSFKENSFEKDLDNMNTDKILNDVFLGLTAALDVGFIALALLPATRPATKTTAILYVIVSGIDLLISIASYTLFRLTKYDITKDYANKAKRFKGTSEYKALDKMLAEDKERNHLLDCNDDGGMSYSEFSENYEKYWKNIPAADFKLLNEHYSDIHEIGVIHDYKKAADNSGLDVEQYTHKLRGWKPDGLWTKLNYGLMGATGVVLAAQFALGALDPKVDAAVKAKELPRAGAQAAETASKNLFQRIAAAFKNLFNKTKEVKDPIKDTAEAASEIKKTGELVQGVEEVKEGVEVIKAVPKEEAIKTIRNVLETIKEKAKEFGGNFVTFFRKAPELSKDMIKHAGFFENVEDGLKWILKQFKTIPRRALQITEEITEEEKFFYENFEKIYAIHKYLTGGARSTALHASEYGLALISTQKNMLAYTSKTGKELFQEIVEIIDDAYAAYRTTRIDINEAKLSELFKSLNEGWIDVFRGLEASARGVEAAVEQANNVSDFIFFFDEIIRI